VNTEPIVIGILTFVITIISSTATATFVAGMRWAEVKGDISSLKSAVSEIKGMFEMRLRDQSDAARDARRDADVRSIPPRRKRRHNER
jgi:hypothetical protein